MEQPTRTKCSCGATIFFIPSPETPGSEIPIDAKAHPIYSQMLSGEWVRLKDARVSHLVTCPDRQQFKQAQRRDARHGDSP